MKESIGKYEFVKRFEEIRPNNFSRAGLETLFDYLENLEDDLGEELEFDPIAFCCDFTEYENLEDFQNDHNDEYETIEDIEQDTIVIKIDGESFITQAF